MRQSSILILGVLVVQAYSAPQFFTFTDGKLGVNFAGYHAGVGLGGKDANGRAAGGIFAEAGTPFGPAAKAGLGGSIDEKRGYTGGLYSGATAGGGIDAKAGVGGSISGSRAVGGLYATSQAAGQSSSSVLEGETDKSGGSDFSFSAHKSVEASVPVHKEVHGEVNIDTINEIASAASAGVEADAGFNVNAHANVQPAVFVKEVSKWRGPHYNTHHFTPNFIQDMMSSLFRIPQRQYIQPMWTVPQHYNYVHQVHVAPPPTEVVVYKHKPHHHAHKTVYVGGYVGAGGQIGAPVVKTGSIDKRVDIGVEGGNYHEGGVNVNEHVGPGKETTFTKQVVVSSNQRPSTFFQDIFNIPISTLKAVSGFLTNTAGSTNISVQKTGTVKAGGYSDFSGHAGYSDKDLIASKHVPSSSSSVASSEAHISVQTPSASQIIGDIFSIPINTLSAVNKFLENNVSSRKRVQVTADGVGEPTRVRLGPYARRRAHKHAVVVQESAKPEPEPKESN